MDALGRSASATVNVNAALSVSPLADFALLSQNKPFTASGGVSPYSFSVQNSLGTINNLTGVFTPSHLGQENVTVTDALGNTASTTVDIFNSVVLTPTSVTLAVNNQTTFVASQGLAPYNFTVSCGTINASGLYTAPASTDTCTVTVTDAHNTTATANVTIAPAISLSPVTATLLTTGTHSFAASGGVPPYTYTMQSGLGTVNGTSGLYTASTTAGTEVVLVTDALGNTATSSVMVVGPLILSPSFQTIASGGTLQLNTSGGLGAKIFSITSGSGSLDSNSGLFIGTSSGLTLVSVTDSLLNTSTGTVTVLAPLNLNPTTATLGASQTITLTASGGQGPYTYSVSAGQGSVNASGLFTAPNTGGTSQVKVTDSFGSQSISNISTLNPLVITPSSITMAESNSYTFAASGGGGSHHFSAIFFYMSS
jgi:hypothetical protein